MQPVAPNPGQRAAHPARATSRSIAAGAAAVAVALLFFFAAPQPSEGAPGFVRFVGRFHPLAVHLPIGVVVLIATAEALTIFRRVRERVDGALGPALSFLVASMVVAFALGTLLAGGGGYPARLLGAHRAVTLAGVFGSAIAMIAWSTQQARGASRLPYRVALFATLGTLSLGAHFGASMTHGETYLTRFAPSPFRGHVESAPPAAAGAGDEPRVFGDVVLPVLQSHCVECHGPDEAKSGLRLDSFAAVMKGGDDGASVVVGSSEESPLVHRMTLPASDDGHMPPDGRRGPTPDEIAVIRWWIDRGATESLRVRDGVVPDAARPLLERTASAGVSRRVR
jgi:hypothetical protein